ncbi:MAG: serine hydrolase [Clostridia bacterium]|nr:serine hydrolase [Clostridia bacterium]
MTLIHSAEMQRELAFWGIPGAALAVCGPEGVRFSGAWGLRDIGRALPMTPNSLCGIASCSKSFTAFVLQSLAEEGRVSLDAPIRSFSDDFRLMDPLAVNVTLRDLLYHRTGVAGHDGLWPNPGWTRKEYLLAIRHLAPNQPFRYVSQYSNVMYNALGALAEEVSGESWEQLVTSRIFEPLGMKRSLLSAALQAEGPDHAVGTFAPERTDPPQPMEPWEMDVGGPAAGVVSSAMDMTRWLRMYLNGGVFEGQRLLSAEGIAEILRPVARMSAFSWDEPEMPAHAWYGMAWKTVFYRGRPLHYHFGEIEGYSSCQLLRPCDGLGMMLVCNRHTVPSAFPMSVLLTVLDRLTGEAEANWFDRLRPTGLEPKSAYAWYREVPLPDPPADAVADPAACAGTYAHPGYGPLKVTEADGRLTLHWKKWLLPLTPCGSLFRVEGLKEDTLYLTLPVTFRGSGRASTMEIPLEPTVAPIVFEREAEA